MIFEKRYTTGIELLSHVFKFSGEKKREAILSVRNKLNTIDYTDFKESGTSDLKDQLQKYIEEKDTSLKNFEDILFEISGFTGPKLS